MSKFRVVPAAQRVDRLLFDPSREYVDHVIQLGAYTCPHCGAEKELSTRLLESLAQEPMSCFAPDLVGELDRARPRGPWEYALDFACPGCGRPVRLVYEPAGEYAMGASRYRIAAAVETFDGSAGEL